MSPSHFPMIKLVAQRDGPFHSTALYYSRADWDGFRDHI